MTPSCKATPESSPDALALYKKMEPIARNYHRIPDATRTLRQEICPPYRFANTMNI